jgi:hypothetical protein
MCDFPYLGISLKPGADPKAETTQGRKQCVASVCLLARRHGLQPLEVHPRKGSHLEQLLGRCDLRFTFRVAHCACDWRRPQLEQVRALVTDLFNAAEIREVTFALYFIKGAVDEGTPHRRLDERTLAVGSWPEPEQARGCVWRVRRGDDAPRPRLKLRLLALGSVVVALAGCHGPTAVAPAPSAQSRVEPEPFRQEGCAAEARRTLIPRSRSGPKRAQAVTDRGPGRCQLA